MSVPGDAPGQVVRCPRCEATFSAPDLTPKKTDREVTTTSSGSDTPGTGSWQNLADPLRRDLSVWFEFGSDEHPLMFLADRDPAGSDTGPAGLLVTDRRVLYRNREGQGSIDLDGDGELRLMKSGESYDLTFCHGRRSRHRRKLAHIGPDDAYELIHTLDELKRPLRVMRT